jgi:hypothetical protein
MAPEASAAELRPECRATDTASTTANTAIDMVILDAIETASARGTL